jgi:hypothetical protein
LPSQEDRQNWKGRTGMRPLVNRQFHSAIQLYEQEQGGAFRLLLAWNVRAGEVVGQALSMLCASTSAFLIQAIPLVHFEPEATTL